MLESFKAFVEECGCSFKTTSDQTIEKMYLINDVGLDSIDIMELIFWMERYLSIEVVDREFYTEVQTVGDVLDFIEKRVNN